jgi:hypothetical protein
MGTAIMETRFPEILKFCTWFKKEQEEKGLQYMHLPVSSPSSNLGFGRSVFFTPQLVVGLESVITSDENLDFSDLEKVCAEFNNSEEMITRGEVSEPPFMDGEDGFDSSVRKIIDEAHVR